MGELVIHGIAPEARSLVLGATATLQTKPGAFGAFHIFPTNARLVVERKACTALRLMRSQVELGYHTSNDVAVELLSVVQRKVLESRPEVCCPLAHNIIRCDHFWPRVICSAAHDNIIDVRVAETRFMSQERGRKQDRPTAPPSESVQHPQEVQIRESRWW